MSRDVRTRVHQKAHGTCIKMRYDVGPDAPNAMMQHTHVPPSKHSATRNPGLKCRQPRVERAGCWVLCAGVGSGGGGACIWRQRRQPGEHRPCVWLYGGPLFKHSVYSAGKCADRASRQRVLHSKWPRHARCSTNEHTHTHSHIIVYRTTYGLINAHIYVCICESLCVLFTRVRRDVPHISDYVCFKSRIGSFGRLYLFFCVCVPGQACVRNK